MSQYPQAFLQFGFNLKSKLPDAFKLDEEGFFDFDEYLEANGGASNCPATVVAFNNGNKQEYLLVLKDAGYSQAYGAKSIDPATMEIAPERLEAFLAYCAALGLKAKPKWWLVSRS